MGRGSGSVFFSYRSPVGKAVPRFPTQGILLAILGSAVLGIQAAAADESGVRKASLPHLTVSVSLDHASSGEPVLIEDFRTDSPYAHSVFCISGFSDMVYVLRDSNGAVIKQTGTGGMDVQSGGIGEPVGGSWDPCKTVGADFQRRVVLLRYLYPQLAPGEYTLYVTLAPRGSPGRASLDPPFTVRI